MLYVYICIHIRVNPGDKERLRENVRMSRRNSQSSSQLAPRGGTPINCILSYLFVVYMYIYTYICVYVRVNPAGHEPLAAYAGHSV